MVRNESDVGGGTSSSGSGILECGFDRSTVVTVKTTSAGLQITIEPLSANMLLKHIRCSNVRDSAYNGAVSSVGSSCREDSTVLTDECRSATATAINVLCQMLQIHYCNLH